MATYKKFYENLYLTEHSSCITACYIPEINRVKAFKDLLDSGRLLCVELEETIFFPTGGGQSCDIGKINDFDVISTEEETLDGEERVYHYLSFENAEAAKKAAEVLKSGAKVNMSIVWEHRFDNMQRHCGEHITSGIFFREYGGVNRGFHMGTDYMTLDISLEADPRYTELTFEMCKHVEMCANEVIWSNAPVTRRVFATSEECKDLPLRKALSVKENISIVCVGSVDNAADCVACCGTHPSTAGQVGLIKIFKVEANKGMFRVYCEAGKRAYKDYQFKHDLYTYMIGRYSATSETLYEQIARDDAKIQATRDELYRLKHAFISERAVQINKAMEAMTPEQRATSISVYNFDEFKVEDLLAIGKELNREIMAKLIVLANYQENSIALLSDGKGCKCGQLVKEYANIYGGKGGGRNDNARAMFPSSEAAETFIDLLQKHLR